MRLICPNCGAQYEVPDEVIPADGRDVQCSACSSTWFQAHSDSADTREDAVADSASMTPPPPAEAKVEPEPEPGPDSQPPAEPEQIYPPVPEETEQAAASPAPQASRRLDPNIAEVLREEAEREQAAREAEKSGSGGLESQPDLGLDEPADEASRRAEQARLRMARMRGETVAPEVAVAAATASAGSRRELLPDIEEINSTLRASGDRKRPATATDADLANTLPKPVRRGRGRRRGFWSVMVVVGLGVATYVFSPVIAQYLPAIEPYLAEYVSQVETARGWLSTNVESALAWLDQVAAENL